MDSAHDIRPVRLEPQGAVGHHTPPSASSAGRGVRPPRTVVESPDGGPPRFGPLAELPPARLDALLERAHTVADRADAWLRDFPVVRRQPVTVCCALASTVAFPRLGEAGLTLLTRWWLWIFGVDDVFDDPRVPDGRLARWSARFAAAHQEGARPPSRPGEQPDLLLTAYDSIRRDLARYPVFAPLERDWSTSMIEVVDGMLTESRWSRVRDPALLPGYDSYLATATRTISLRPYALTACAVSGNPAAAREFARLDPLIEAAAHGFRLANDLKPQGGERAEGELDAVGLLERRYLAQGIPPPEAARAARERITADCLADLTTLRTALRSAPAPLRDLSYFLWSHTAFVRDLYRHHDYDTASALLLRHPAPEPLTP